MKEPTYREHLILVNMETESSISLKDSDPELDQYMALVRGGYLKNLVIIGGIFDWCFKLTGKAEEYLKDTIQ